MDADFTRIVSFIVDAPAPIEDEPVETVSPGTLELTRRQRTAGRITPIERSAASLNAFGVA